VAEDGQIIMLVRQGRSRVAATVLLAGQERSLVPGQGGFVVIVEDTVVIPGNGTEDTMAVATQTTDVFGGKGAAIRNEQHVVGQRQVLVQQIELFLDGRVAIAVAIEDVTVDREGPEVIDGGGHSNLEHLVFGEVTVGDVGGRQFAVAPQGLGCLGGTRHGRGVGSVEDQVGRVEVETIQGHLGPAQHIVGDTGEDGMALVEEGIESTAESIIVEFVGGQIPDCTFP
jgi:hypothetical protein